MSIHIPNLHLFLPSFDTPMPHVSEKTHVFYPETYLDTYPETYLDTYPETSLPTLLTSKTR